MQRALSDGPSADHFLQQLSALRTQLNSAERRAHAAEHKAAALASQLSRAQAAVDMISALTGMKAVHGCPRSPLRAQ